MARLITQSQASARTHSVATNIVNFVYGFKAQSVTKFSTRSQPVIRPNKKGFDSTLQCEELFFGQA